jgi:hypothetical protein
MKERNSVAEQGQAPRLYLLQAASEGRLDVLPCLQCGEASVSVWFTRRSESDYWTWFLCDRCDFEMRAQGDRPAHYSPEREFSMRAATEKQRTVGT